MPSTSRPEDASLASPTMQEYFLRLFVILLGIGVGYVLSVVIGLFSGWVPFC